MTSWWPCVPIGLTHVRDELWSRPCRKRDEGSSALEFFAVGSTFITGTINGGLNRLWLDVKAKRTTGTGNGFILKNPGKLKRLALFQESVAIQFMENIYCSFLEILPPCGV